jgi:RNA polymerase sigma factor (TIGR02999 family)
MTAEGALHELSGLLSDWGAGDEEALSKLVSVVYPEMRRLARLRLNARPANYSIQSADLANEAYLKLVRAKGISCEDRVHFFALCAQIIRRILFDHTRNHLRAKRGGNMVQVPLDEALLGTRARGIDLLDLDRALSLLSEFDARKGRVVELRYFGGLSVEETATILQISPETVLRDWRMAKTWLFRELTGKRTPS